MSLSNWKTIMFAGGSAALCGVAYKLLKQTSLVKMFEKQCSDLACINEFLFYGAGDDDASERLGLDNLFCIFYVVLHANTSVDVCMPSLMSDTITKCLLEVQKKGSVTIRVIIHKSKNHSQVVRLKKAGIEVKAMDSEDNPAHEFILVDGGEGGSDAVALVGSLDYDVGRVNRHRDHTLLTSEPVLVTALKKEFERIWGSVVSDVDVDEDTSD
ncbi:mitochondrial cardiolipin hydrolase-like [Plutella xylostella]|uniref:mitochondrial cardiolipin hydrolase-like n=1 Tax=Plutella xylostella TaxID=51655 RepID=UPI002032B4DA|nr:mitochondrial cardiolipin hydrolase-like [Plutella xylostella]